MMMDLVRYYSLSNCSMVMIPSEMNLRSQLTSTHAGTQRTTYKGRGSVQTLERTTTTRTDIFSPDECIIDATHARGKVLRALMRIDVDRNIALIS